MSNGGCTPPRTINATTARYIKLGPKGRWEGLCIADGTVRFGYNEVPAELATTRNRDLIRAHFLAHGSDVGKASDKAREVMDFYDGDEAVLWITFSRGHMWWCFAESAVIELGTNNVDGGRMRRAKGGWSNQSAGGSPLHMNDLNGRLTRTAAYRQTVCTVAALDYLLARLNDEMLPQVAAATAARAALIETAVELLRLMAWQDFELLVDLAFSTTGWRRVGVVGGAQKTIDIELVLPTTGERAFVQVKSATTQAEFDEYVAALAGRPEGRMFYAYHTAQTDIEPGPADVVMIGPQRLAEMVLEAERERVSLRFARLDGQTRCHALHDLLNHDLARSGSARAGAVAPSGGRARSLATKRSSSVLRQRISGRPRSTGRIPALAATVPKLCSSRERYTWRPKPCP